MLIIFSTSLKRPKNVQRLRECITRIKVACYSVNWPFSDCSQAVASLLVFLYLALSTRLKLFLICVARFPNFLVWLSGRWNWVFQIRNRASKTFNDKFRPPARQTKSLSKHWDSDKRKPSQSRLSSDFRQPPMKLASPRAFLHFCTFSNKWSNVTLFQRFVEHNPVDCTAQRHSRYCLGRPAGHTYLH